MVKINLKTKTLESWIRDAACFIRRSQDAANGAERYRLSSKAARRVGAAARIKDKDHILPLIFKKRVCDGFDDELNRTAKEVGSRKNAFQLVEADQKLVGFYLPLTPDDLVQPVIRELSKKICEGRGCDIQNPTVRFAVRGGDRLSDSKPRTEEGASRTEVNLTPRPLPNPPSRTDDREDVRSPTGYFQMRTEKAMQSHES